MAMEKVVFAALLRDVAAEADELIGTLTLIADEQWTRPTPATGWNIHDQVVHLAFFDDLVGLGFRDPDEFVTTADALQAVGEDWVDRLSHDRSDLPPAEVLAWFSASRRSAITMFERIGPAARSPWFGPPMSAASSATARLMETWAHGQDVYDTLGVERGATARIRHICHLGVLTRGFSYSLHGRALPPTDVRVELTSPTGELWTWGMPELTDRITGSAHDFALVVTQRRNIADTLLQATPGPAAEWMDIAQAFAGSPGPGRTAGDFPLSSREERT